MYSIFSMTLEGPAGVILIVQDAPPDDAEFIYAS